MERISDPANRQTPTQSSDTAPSHISRLRRFPWWVFLPVGLCLCAGAGSFVWMSSDLQQQAQATATAQAAVATARAAAHLTPTQFDHPPGFGIITETPEPRTATRAAILDVTQTAQAALARSNSLLAATQTAVGFAAASLPTSTPEIINPEYSANASANPPNPLTPNGAITVTGKLSKRGQAVQGAIMSVTLGTPSQSAPIDGARTSTDGIAAQTLDIGPAAPGVKVVLHISFYLDGQLVARTSANFTPQR